MSSRSFRRANARRTQRERCRLSRLKRHALVAGATLGASAVLAANAQADTYTVTSTNDPGAVDEGCVAVGASGTQWSCPTLREALTATNLHNASHIADTIDLSTLSGTITLSSGELPVKNGNPLTIRGPGASTLSVSGNGKSRVFNISSPKGTAITISGLTITNGSGSGNGGAILNEQSSLFGSSLTLADDVVSGSKTVGHGGGVFSVGPLTITGSTISGDTAGTDSNGYGGGVYAKDGLNVGQSIVTGNQAYAGGGIALKTKYKTTITNSVISSNNAAYGGGLWTGTNYSASSSPDNSVTIQNTTVSGNTATAQGGGVEIGSDRSPNAPVTIAASTISGNSVTGKSSDNPLGGGLSIYSQIANPIDVIDSTISGNTAPDGGGVSVGYPGRSVIDPGSKGSIAFDNSTIALNTASAHGGGIFLAEYSPAVTLPGLQAATLVSSQQSATVGLNSTIVAGDKAGSSQEDLYRKPSTGGGGFNANYSLIQTTDAALLLTKNQTILGVDPQLGALGDNGGPTQTMLPSGTSPAIDQGKAASGLSTDQRGSSRTVDRGHTQPPGGDGTDIGAVELAAIVKPGSSPAAVTPISATVDPATGITSSQATLNGKINTNGIGVTWHFQWGRTTGYGQTTPSQSISAGHAQVPVSFLVKGLTPNTVYHYRVIAVGSGGQTATSSDATFKTPAPSIKVHPGTVRAGKKVRVFGRAGGCTTGNRVTLISDAFSSAHMFAGKNAIFATVLPGDRYSVITMIPANRVPDRYAITGRCGGGNFGVTAYLRVLPVTHVKAVKVTVRFTG